MPKLAANLSMMFTEHDFLARFERAARHGFRGVEFLFPYEHIPQSIAEALAAAGGIEIVLFNLPPGDWQAGERGLAGLPGREAEFRDALEEALRYAEVLGCRRLHAMHGIPATGGSYDRSDCRVSYIQNLRHAARRAQKQDIEVLIEPLNQRDVPGYPLNTQREAREVVLAVGEPNLRIQFDMYHCQIVEGDLTMTFKEVQPYVGHIQIAGVPERHEPSVGEARYEYLLGMLDAEGYDGWVGCEYRPAAGTAEGLGWAEHYGISSAPGAVR